MKPNKITAANRRGPLRFVAAGNSSVSLRCSRSAHLPIAEVAAFEDGMAMEADKLPRTFEQMTFRELVECISNLEH